MIIRYLWANHDKNLKFMIIDLDAHQGNGYGLDKLTFLPRENENVFILDMYNKDIYPQDTLAKATINRKVEIDSSNTSKDYLFFLDV